MKHLLVVVALLLIMSSHIYMGASRKVLPGGMLGKEKRFLLQSEDLEHPGASVNNHHSIPRQDFNNYSGGGSKGSGDGDETDGGGKV